MPSQPHPTCETTALKARVAACVDAERAALLALSARIHAHPELCFENAVPPSGSCEFLDSRGLTVERGAYGLPTAFAARAGSGRPRIAVLCEYDALPGIGHACGHNIIAAAGAGAGVALAAVVAETGGSVVVLGTPAEEGGGGKVTDGARGRLRRRRRGDDDPPRQPRADRRCTSWPSAPSRSSTAAAPRTPPPRRTRGINALDALVTAYQAIAQLRQHIRPSERIHGIITDGGQKPNIVPERAAGLFYVRAANERHLGTLKQRVEACFQAGALAQRRRVSTPRGRRGLLRHVDQSGRWRRPTSANSRRSAAPSTTAPAARSAAAPTWATSASWCRRSTR